jgi:hypothetical protein
MRDYWVSCNKCEQSWIAQFSLEQGCLFAADEYGESCEDCGSDDLEIGSEYVRRMPSGYFYVILLVPNFLLWGLV